MTLANLSARPLVGEPIALDLVNTQWNEAGVEMDLLSMEGGLDQWLTEHDLPQPHDHETARGALVQTRSAIRGCLKSADSDARAMDALNETLKRGHIIPRLTENGPGERIDIADGWYAAWTAARGYLELRAQWPNERIRACAHPDCILYFLDQTRSGTRRWCDMRTCGNRAKARRYHQRHG